MAGLREHFDGYQNHIQFAIILVMMVLAAYPIVVGQARSKQRKFGISFKISLEQFDLHSSYENQSKNLGVHRNRGIGQNSFIGSYWNTTRYCINKSDTQSELLWRALDMKGQQIKTIKSFNLNEIKFDVRKKKQIQIDLMHLKVVYLILKDLFWELESIKI